MRDRGPTQRLNNPSYWREFSSYGAALIHWASQGFGLVSQQRVSISGLGTKLQTLRPGDPAIAQDIARGNFCFAGEIVTGTPVKVFDSTPPSSEWASDLHNLSWLQHFVASDHELQRIIARSLVLKWGEQHRFLWAAPIQFRALISLSLAAHFLVGPSPSSFEKPLCALIVKLIRHTLAMRPTSLDDKLLQAIALQHTSLAFRGSMALRDHANAQFCAFINQVILPDGGHVSRSPQMLMETLLDIIPIKDAMIAKHEAVPQPLNAAIERMVPMLRMLSHGDRGLSHFQGSGTVNIDGIKAILEHDKIDGRPLLLAPHSGYCRLAHRSGLIILDAGVPNECNSPLAFEFSDGPHRIFSNCGMPRSASAAWQMAAADIAAHNTVEVVSYGSETQNAPRAEVITSPQGSLINCTNEISGKPGKIKHQRNVFLSQTGNDLRGEDHILQVTSKNPSPKQLDFTIRFHLHPGVKATSTRKGTRIVVMLANRTAWQFSARGGTISLEDSVFLGDGLGPRKTQQIVIRGSTDSSAPVKWALRRVEKSATTEKDMAETPRLPF
jgi:uncharacterized heparinase superfamily protein